MFNYPTQSDAGTISTRSLLGGHYAEPGKIVKPAGQRAAGSDSYGNVFQVIQRVKVSVSEVAIAIQFA
jgi:hypothetical protein